MSDGINNLRGASCALDRAHACVRWLEDRRPHVSLGPSNRVDPFAGRNDKEFGPCPRVALEQTTQLPEDVEYILHVFAADTGTKLSALLQ